MSKAVAKESCRTAFCAAASAFSLLRLCVRRQFRSALFCPRKRPFLPAVFVAAVLPGFPGNGCLFCRKVVLYPRKKASEHRSGHLFYCFLPFLQCFL